MKLPTLKKMLERVAESDGPVFTFAQGISASLLIATDGQELTVERITTIELCDGFVEAKTSRSQRFLVEVDAVVGMSLSDEKVDSANAGFFSR